MHGFASGDADASGRAGSPCRASTGQFGSRNRGGVAESLRHGCRMPSVGVRQPRRRWRLVGNSAEAPSQDILDRNIRKETPVGPQDSRPRRKVSPAFAMPKPADSLTAAVCPSPTTSEDRRERFAEQVVHL